MKKLAIVLIVIVGLLVVLGITAAGGYNGLVGKKQAVNSSWAQVLNQYQRRADLVPNLVKTVQGSADFEKSVLENVVKARASVGQVTVDPNQAPTDAATLQKFQQAQGSFGSALSRLLVVSERYPDLKASAGFRDLQAQLEGTENRISVERGRFNETTRDYNTAIGKFPAVLYAAMAGFTARPYFQADPGTEKPPEVDFNFGEKKPAGQ